MGFHIYDNWMNAANTSNSSNINFPQMFKKYLNSLEFGLKEEIIAS